MQVLIHNAMEDNSFSDKKNYQAKEIFMPLMLIFVLCVPRKVFRMAGSIHQKIMIVYLYICIMYVKRQTVIIFLNGSLGLNCDIQCSNVFVSLFKIVYLNVLFQTRRIGITQQFVTCKVRHYFSTISLCVLFIRYIVYGVLSIFISVIEHFMKVSLQLVWMGLSVARM